MITAHELGQLAAKYAEDYTLVHYARDKRDQLKPLSYDELTAHRTRGRWANDPDKVKAYVDKRRWFEKELHKRLAARNVPSDPNNSFLYATLADHELFGKPGAGEYRHEAPLAPDIVNSSFFDVVGTGKSRTTFGEKGLKQALKRWRAAKDAGTLKTEKFMGMDIHPRIEIITPANITPSNVVSY